MQKTSHALLTMLLYVTMLPSASMRLPLLYVIQSSSRRSVFVPFQTIEHFSADRISFMVSIIMFSMVSRSFI